MTLERAGGDDVPAVVALMNHAFRGRGADAGWTSEADLIDGDRTSEALLRGELAAAHDAVLLVERSGEDRAVLASVWLEPRGADVWGLGSLTVSPALQNAGAGRRVLAQAEAWAAARGARTIRLRVIGVRTTLIEWYERRGYRRTGETEPFPHGDARFGAPRRDDLAFVVLEKTPPG